MAARRIDPVSSQYSTIGQVMLEPSHKRRIRARQTSTSIGARSVARAANSLDLRSLSNTGATSAVGFVYGLDPHMARPIRGGTSATIRHVLDAKSCAAH